MDAAPAPADSTDAADLAFLGRAVSLARASLEEGRGGPFGAVIVREGRILSEGVNRVTISNDPTAHAEIVAIREAARSLGDYRLTGCVLYASCEPCPMCLAAVYWARIGRLVFAASREDASRAGFDDARLYDELARPVSARTLRTRFLPDPEARAVLEAWRVFPGKIPY